MTVRATSAGLPREPGGRAPPTDDRGDDMVAHRQEKWRQGGDDVDAGRVGADLLVALPQRRRDGPVVARVLNPTGKDTCPACERIDAARSVRTTVPLVAVMRPDEDEHGRSRPPPGGVGTG